MNPLNNDDDQDRSRLRNRFGDLVPTDNGIALLKIFFVIVVGWLVISTIQYIFQTFFLEKINNFWILIFIVILLVILYYSLVKATNSGFYLFPFIAINERIEN